MLERSIRVSRIERHRDQMAKKESAAWEHSEPGTGPIPVYSDPEKDKSIKTGSRRDTPPIAYPQPEPEE